MPEPLPELRAAGEAGREVGREAGGGGATAADLADLALLEAAARAAGPVALGFWRHAPEAWEKPGDAGPVSEADLAVNRVLQASLTSARPGYGWLSEESPDDLTRLGQDDLFIIDPIDGTRAFLAGEKEFAIALAVVRRGKAVAGLVHLPARDLTYKAALGGGAFCNGRAIGASARSDITGAKVMTNRANLDPKQWPGGLPDMRQEFRSSLAFRLCMAAEGRADLMLSLRPTWEWDSAAGALIAAEAGCAVSDRHGAPLQFNASDPRSDGVIAAPPALFAAILQGLGSKAAP